MGNDGEDLWRLKTPPEAPPPIVWASQVVTKSVQWIWPGRVPMGKILTVAGAGGIGKSFVLCDLVARVSAGLEWPFSGGECATPGKVLYVSGEDDPDDTLVPRMIQQGADLDRIAFLTPEYLPTFHLQKPEQLDRTIEEMAGVVLMIIDPPVAFMNGVSDASNAGVRQALLPLKLWASEKRITVIFNTHLNKGKGKPVDAQMRVMGSVAWINVPRIAHLVTRDPGEPSHRLFVPLKTNLGGETKALSFRITETESLACLEWMGEVDLNADEALNGKPEKDSLKTWLIRRFQERREWMASDLAARLKADLGLNMNNNGTFHRAKGKVGIKSRKIGREWQLYVTEDWAYADLS